MALFLVLAPASQAQILITRDEVRHDESPALRDMAAAARRARVGKPLEAAPEEAEPVRIIPLPDGFKPPADPDMVLQHTTSAAPAGLAPTLMQNFDGIGQGVAGFFVQFAPPDTNGAVGLTQYVQWVNVNFAVYDKATTNLLLGPVAGNTLWTGFGGLCEANNDGDPIAQYDKLADRWVLSQFVVRGPGPGGLGPTFLQCVAVSKTSDATGAYNRYAFSYPAFDDYPKMGVWPDAYYVTFNMFTPPSLFFSGADACAYDRNAMLNGLAATQVCFQQGANVEGLLPSDVDGLTAPPAGEPNFVMHFTANALNLYKFHADFAVHGNSTFTGPTIIPVSPFTPLCGGSRGCVPQSGDPTALDSLADRLMYRLAYRNFGDHESLVVNHSVTANTSSGGVRWYEIQNPNGTPVVAQQSTFAPDSSFRWMGSVAMDRDGNMALGYSVSSATMFPSIAMTGRLAGDPASTMQPETAIFTGTGTQINGLTRWGDYSAMQVDPVDDCTFWFTSEYLKVTGSFNWNTRIASLKFPTCGFPDLSLTKTHTGNFTQGQPATYTLTVTNTGAKPTDGTTVTVTDTLPAKLTATAATGTGWTCVLGPPVSCTRSDAVTRNNSYPPITLTVAVAADAPASIANTATVSGGGDQSPGNNQATDTATVIQTGPDPAITKTHTGVFIQGQTGTYTLTVSNAGLSPTSGTVTVTDALPSGLTANAASGTGWTCVLGPPVSCSRADALASNASYPSIALVVNVSVTASASLINTAVVSGGGDTNSLNNTANDPTTTIPPPPDLTITKTHVGNFHQGQTAATYTLTVSNPGAGATSGTVTVTDNIPAGLTGTSIFGLGWNCNNATMSCNRIDSLASGGSYQALTVLVTVSPSAPSTVINSATVSGGGDISPGNNTANDSTTVLPTPDLAIAMTHTPSPFVVGQSGTYTISVSNTGNGPTSGAVTVTDNLPFGMTATTVSGAGWSCAAGSPVLCSRSDALPAAGSYPDIAVTVFVVGGGPSVTNTAGVSGGGEFNLANDFAGDVTAISAPLLGITMSHVGSFTVGQIGTYTITVSNQGSAATFGNITMTDFLPPGFQAIAAVGKGWNCLAPPFSSGSCMRSDALAPASSYPPISLTVSVQGGAPSQTNIAQVSGGGDQAFHGVNDTTIVIGPTLGLALTHGTFTSSAGSLTATVSNTGSAATSGTVFVSDNLPFGTIASAIVAPGWTCTAPPATVVDCNRSDKLRPGQSYPQVVIGVTVSSGGFLFNSATMRGGGDSNFHFVTDSVFVPQTVLTINKSHIGNFTLGQPGVYTVTVGNSGIVPTSGTVTVADQPSPGLVLTGASGTGWTCAITAAISCTRSDVLPGDVSYPPLTINVNVIGGGFVINTASVSGGGDTQVRFASDPTTVVGPVLAITKTHVGNFTVGQPAAYTINVSNTGTVATAGTVTVTDFLPTGMTLAGSSGTGWSCTGTNFVNCTRSDALAGGAAYPALVLNLSVGDSFANAVNTASVVGGGDSSSHFSSDPTIVNAPLLTLASSHTPDPMIVGQTGTLTINVGNVGAVATVGTVTVTDQLLFGLTTSGAFGTGWTCTTSGQVSCTRSDSLAVNGSYPPITVPISVSGTGGFSNFVNVSGGGDASFHSVSDLINISSPLLGIAMTHAGNFTVGQPGTYTITVNNNAGTVATAGLVTVTDFVPFGMTPGLASGTGWTCSGTFPVSCSRSDALAPGASYPAISLTVNVTGGGPSILNTATLNGGGDGQTHLANDLTFITTPTMIISKSHTGVFSVGQIGTYTMTVSNPGNVATVGTVSVADFLPIGLTAVGITATGWSCTPTPTTSMTCTRNDSLAGGASFPSIAMAVSVDANAPSVLTNQAFASGGGDVTSHSALDVTSINVPDLAITSTHVGDFGVGQTGVYTITVSNVGVTTIAGTGTITVEDFLPGGVTATSANGTGWTCALLNGPPQQMNCTRPADALTQGSSYPPITLNVNVAPDAPASVVTNVADVLGIGDADFSNNVSFDPTRITGFRFVPVTPCRIVDTRNPAGPFGGPFIAGNTTREINIPTSACGIPATAQAYSLNVTVVPKTTLGFLTMFPCGQPLPLASTLNSIDGRTKAAAAILPAGANGSVCAFPTNDTELVMDIDGYFVPPADPAGLAFYPLTPCRLVDTRLATGTLGGPSLAGNAARSFPILTSSCAVPAAAKAYSLNYTVVPKGPLGFLTTWPAGSPQPLVSTLNAPTGGVTANAAIVPAGTNGDISVFVTNPADLVLDIDGYFGPPGPGGLSLLNVTPCRVLDTRNAGGAPFNGQIDVSITASPCAIPAVAQSFVFNATVVPPAPLGFLTLWPQAALQPLVSTLNAQDSAITSNMAIVPTTNGAISAFSSQATHLVLDISGYFAP